MNITCLFYYNSGESYWGWYFKLKNCDNVDPPMYYWRKFAVGIGEVHTPTYNINIVKVIHNCGVVGHNGFFYPETNPLLVEAIRFCPTHISEAANESAPLPSALLK